MKPIKGLTARIAALAAAALIAVFAMPVATSAATSVFYVTNPNVVYAPNSVCLRAQGIGTYNTTNLDGIIDAAADAVSYNKIHICAGTYYSVTDQEITLDANLTLEGEGAGTTVIDGANYATSFVGAGNLTVTGITFQNMRGGDCQGGAIYVNGSLTLKETEFMRNAAWGCQGGADANSGGAVYVTGSTNVTNSTFIDNSTGFVDINDFGGAIYGEGPIAVTGSTFLGNRARHGGGAIYGENSITIKTSSFVKNRTRKGHGGAVYAANNYTTTISTTTMRGNQAGSYNWDGCFVSCYLHSHWGRGGAVYGVGAVVVNGNSLLLNNTAGQHGYGGAIYGERAITFTSSRLKDNSTGYDGGAVYAGGLGNVTVTSSDVRGSQAQDGSGGAIFAEEGANVALKSSSFINNYANDYGGAIWDCGLITVASSTLNNNWADNNTGGAINNDCGATTITSSTLNNNDAGTQGGAVWSEANVTIKTSTLNHNFADNYGAIYVDANLNVSGSTLLRNDSNSAEDVWDASGVLTNTRNVVPGSATPGTAGTGFVVANSDVLYPSGSICGRAKRQDDYVDTTGTVIQDAITDAITAAHNASVWGATVRICAGTYTSVELIATNDWDMPVTLVGDGIGTTILFGATDTMILTSEADLNVSGMTLTDGDNGAISADHSDVSITLSELSINQNAGGSGGAVFVTDGSLSINRSELNNNWSTNSGGAVYAINAPVTVTSSTLNENDADEDGGAIYTSDTSSLTVTSSKFNGNNADLNGGAIYAGSAPVLVTGSSINGGCADEGGAIYAESGTVTVRTSAMNANWGDRGGAIYAASDSLPNGSVFVTSSNLDGNKAWYEGGAIWSASKVVVDRGEFHGNFTGYYGWYGPAQSLGGAIYTHGLAMVGSSMVNNEAMNNGDYTLGGAVWSDGPVSITTSKLLFNQAISEGGGGGAIYTYGTNITITSSRLDYNQAGLGGAILADGSCLNTFINLGSIPECSGGATVRITSSKVNGNWAGIAGAIFVDGNLYTTNSTVVGNWAISAPNDVAIWYEVTDSWHKSGTVFID
jgi:hypothetical protein